MKIHDLTWVRYTLSCSLFTSLIHVYFIFTKWKAIEDYAQFHSSKWDKILQSACIKIPPTKKNHN